MKDSVVLITTAICPPEGVYVLQMANTTKRIITCRAAALFWAASGVRNIVVADATGKSILSVQEINLLAELDVNVEQISYSQDSALITEYGKGYGEGLLINYAIENSKIINRVGFFYKCTGKLMVNNYKSIERIVQKNNLEALFWFEKPDDASKLDTRFFFSSVNFFKEILLPAYMKVNDKNNFYAEHSIASIPNDVLKKSSTLRPLIFGYSGSTDEQYNIINYGVLETHYPCRYVVSP